MNKNTSQKLIIIDNASSKKFTQLNTISTNYKSKRNKVKESVLVWKWM